MSSNRAALDRGVPWSCQRHLLRNGRVFTGRSDGRARSKASSRQVMSLRRQYYDATRPRALCLGRPFVRKPDGKWSCYLDEQSAWHIVVANSVTPNLTPPNLMGILSI